MPDVPATGILLPMLRTTRNQAIALAGLAQAVHLVQQIAKRGQADREAMEISIASALKIDADTVEDVYGGITGLRDGLLKLKQQMGGREHIDPEHARYSALLVFLENKLEKRPDVQKQLRAGLEKAAAQAETAPSVTDESVLEILADTYQQNISPLGPRIIISGERLFLTDPDNAHKIRALLLAGIRSAVLWRQCGGARWKFLLNRRRLQQETQALIDQID
ncbi:MAG: high frequency lysogenization protein HflD [Methylohalobius crimeensis]